MRRDTGTLGRTRHVAGLAALIREDLETAVAFLEEAMELQRGDRSTADGGDPERAARLLGALREMWGTVGGPPFGYMAAYREQCAAIARERLGTERYEALVEEGGRFDTDHAIAYALGDRTAVPEAAALTGPSSPLTRREAEIARLVARGMTNKEIAATLMIARRTAEGHVEHILTKLGFNSRARIAAWVDEQEQAGPDPPE